MIDDLKKYLDSLAKKKLKEHDGSFTAANIPSCKGQEKEEIDYSKWVTQIVSTNIVRKFPQTEAEIDLVEFLCVELLYKKNIKDLADSEHFIVNEALAKLSIDAVEINFIIDKLKSFDGSIIDYYILFKDEIDSEQNTLLAIQERIDSLSIDSRQGSVVSHAAKMTNPECKYPRIKVQKESANDGYLRTGNNVVEFDLHINATKLKVFKFLSLKNDGMTFFDIVKNNDYSAFVELFLVDKERALRWIDDFSACVLGQDLRTHPSIKQVYFPVEDAYHQLSVIQPSGLVFLLKSKIDLMNDKSPKAYYGKKAKKDGKYFDDGFSSVINLTVTRHGGDHPKNISGLNNKYQSYYLLPSEPPQLKLRDIQFPTVDFFTQTFSYYRSRDLFQALHKLFVSYHNDWQVRAERDAYYQSIIDRIIERMWLVRAAALEQFNSETSQLNKNQKIWLCDEHEEKRNSEDGWLDDITEQVARYIFNGYEKILGKKAFMFSDDEFKHIHKLVIAQREALR